MDEIERQQRKEHAEKAWAKNNAEAAGLELSEDEDDALAAAAAAAQTKSKKRRRQQQQHGVGDDGDSQAMHQQQAAANQLAGRLKGLKGQLQAALSVPLQHNISQKYFTGGGSALAAAAVAKSTGGGEGVEVGGVMPGSVVAQTVGLATRLQQSRSGGEAGGSGSGEGRGILAGKGKKEKGGKKNEKQGKGGKVDMSRLLMSKNEMKRRKRQGMVVVGQGAAVFGRDTLGPSALQVLKSRAGAGA